MYYLSATTPPYRNQCAVMSPHLHVSDKPCGKTDRVTRAWRPREKRDKRDRHVNCVTERLSDYMKYTCKLSRTNKWSNQNFFVGWIFLSWSLFRWSSSTIYVHSHVREPYSKSYNLATNLFILSIFCFSFN